MSIMSSEMQQERSTGSNLEYLEPYRDFNYSNTGPEPFASADQAARFLAVKRRFLLELARQGIAGAYPVGTGQQRRTWVFRLSELSAAIAGRRVQ